MKGTRLILPEPGRIELEEFEIDALPDDALLVRNDFTAISVGTEINNWMHGGNPGAPLSFPYQPGYSNAGTVLDAGRRVKGIKPGDRVAGQSRHASHAILQKGYQKVPENVSTKAASLMIMAAIAMHGIRVGRVELGESVVVFGLGVVGQIAASLARISGGIPIIGIDLDSFRLEKAKTRGIDIGLNPTNVDDLVQTVVEFVHEDGANVLIEATGKPIVYPQAVRMVATRGRLIALGSPRGTIEFNFLDDVHIREVSLHGAYHPITPEADHLYYHWTKDRDRKLLLRLMSEGRLLLDDLVTHVVEPEQCAETYTKLAERQVGTLGVLFDWREGES